MKLLSTIVPAAAVLALLTGCSAAKSQPPIIINGNAYGLWSPTHPHLVRGTPPPAAIIRISHPVPIAVPSVEVEASTELTTFNDVCPTQLSQPQLCE